MTRINCIFIAKIKQILVQPGRKKKKAGVLFDMEEKK